MTDNPPKSFWDVEGHEVPCGFTADPDLPAAPGSPFRERMLTSTSGPVPSVTPAMTQVLQRRLVVPVDSNEWRDSDLLDNEVRIGLHLVRVFGNGYGYPAELSRLVGYDIDAEQPFILFAPYSGRPAEQVVRRIAVTQEPHFEASLLRAIRLLEIARVVHGRIGPATTRWDEADAAVQLTDFSQATMAGERRRGWGEAPWSSAEQVAGTGQADGRDDVWSVGQLIYYVITGRLARGPGTPPDPSPRGSALHSRLGHALDPDTAKRPASEQFLRRLNIDDPRAPRATAVDPRFAEGQRKFDERLADKRDSDPTAPKAPQPRAQGPGPAASSPGATQATPSSKARPGQRGPAPSAGACSSCSRRRLYWPS